MDERKQRKKKNTEKKNGPTLDKNLKFKNTCGRKNLLHLPKIHKFNERFDSLN